MEDILKNNKRVRAIIIDELKEVEKKYSKPRKTLINYDHEEQEFVKEEEEIPDYPVHLFFTREGYFKKITPLSLRMSGEHKLKDGDEIMMQVESSNAAELLFFTNKCQVYKTRACDFDDTKTSVMGDYIAAKLEMEEGEVPLYMAVTKDYAGHMLFIFENGKAAKVRMDSYSTKTRRKKLLNAYSNKSPAVHIRYMHDEGELAVFTSAGRLLCLNTKMISEKTAKDTQGVAAITLKKNHRIDRVTDFVAEQYSDPHRYKTKSLPATGAILKNEDVGEQISF